MEKETRPSHEDLEDLHGSFFIPVLEAGMYMDRPELLEQESLADIVTSIRSKYKTIALQLLDEYDAEQSVDNELMTQEEQRLFTDWRLADSKLISFQYGDKSAARFGASQAMEYGLSAASANWYMDVIAAWVNAALDNEFVIIKPEDTYEQVLGYLDQNIEWASQSENWVSRDIDPSKIDADIVSELEKTRSRLKEVGYFPDR